MVILNPVAHMPGHVETSALHRLLDALYATGGRNSAVQHLLSSVLQDVVGKVCWAVAHLDQSLTACSDLRRVRVHVNHPTTGALPQSMLMTAQACCCPCSDDLCTTAASAGASCHA
jgi:hypothetical protein